MIALNKPPHRGVRPAGSVGPGAVLSEATLLVDAPAPTPTSSDAPTTVSTSSAGATEFRPRPLQRIGPYRLVERLGRGAQGEVWKAVGEVGRGFQALKILNPGTSINPRRLAQFRREAERGARLDGPSLLRVVDTGEADGCFYMAMPYVEAVTLADVIRERRLRRDDREPEPEPVHPLVDLDRPSYYLEAARVLAGVARALHRVHARRVAHRDVKPGNVLLERRAPHRAFLCDLGLGRDLDHATVEQMRDGAGTPMYMAPERLLRAPADEVLADVYSMGVTSFEALTLGRMVDPIRDVPPPALGPILARARRKAPRAVDPELPASLEAVLLGALARSSRDRFQSAEELADALEAAVPKARRELGLGVSPASAPHFRDARRLRAR